MKEKNKKYYRAHGKLLLTAEYFVLDGALALAVPTRFGQEMTVQGGFEDLRIREFEEPDRLGRQDQLHWISLDQNGHTWFEGWFVLPEGRMASGSDKGAGERLTQIIRSISRQQPDVWANQNLEITTQLEFPRDWGLGSSSTLIACLAAWAQVDPYLLLADTFGGSGYDIACAFADGPVLYRVEGDASASGRRSRLWRTESATLCMRGERVDFAPLFSDRLYFVYLGKKQDSREGIRRYRELAAGSRDRIEKVTQLTKAMLETTDADTFGTLMAEHEQLVEEALQLQPIQEQYFRDFPGRIKSLGAWGGDFALALSPWDTLETKAYFARKGKDTVLVWKEMVLDIKPVL